MFQSFHFKRKIEALWKEHGWLVALPWGCAGSLARGGGVSQMCVAVITLPGQCLGGANLFLSPSPGEQEHAACPAPWVPLTWAPLAQQGWGVAAHPPLLPHCPPPPPSPAMLLGMVRDRGTHQPHLASHSASSSTGCLGAPCRSRSSRAGWGR